jgi:hypothetical protein
VVAVAGFLGVPALLHTLGVGAGPDDLSIAPDTTVTVSMLASGSTTDPAECSFNGVACRLGLAAVV